MLLDVKLQSCLGTKERKKNISPHSLYKDYLQRVIELGGPVEICDKNEEFELLAISRLVAPQHKQQERKCNECLDFFMTFFVKFK